MKERGFIVVLVAFSLVTLFTFGTFLLEISKADFNIGNTQVARSQAYYNAESGINKVLAQVRADQDVLGVLKTKDAGQYLDVNVAPESFGEGAFFWPDPVDPELIRLNILEKDNNYVTISLSDTGTYAGKYGQGTKNLKVQAKLNTWSLPTNGAIVTEGEVILKKDGTVEGEIYIGEEGLIPEFELTQFSDWQAPPPGWDGNLAVLDKNVGNYFCTEPVDFYGVYDGHFILAFEDSLNLVKATAITAAGPDNYVDNSLIVISFGNIEIEKDNAYSGVFIAPDGYVNIKKAGNFTGTILCKEYLYADKDFTIVYNNNLATEFMTFINQTRIDIVYWK